MMAKYEAADVEESLLTFLESMKETTMTLIEIPSEELLEIGAEEKIKDIIERSIESIKDHTVDVTIQEERNPTKETVDYRVSIRSYSLSHAKSKMKAFEKTSDSLLANTKNSKRRTISETVTLCARSKIGIERMIHNFETRISELVETKVKPEVLKSHNEENLLCDVVSSDGKHYKFVDPRRNFFEVELTVNVTAKREVTDRLKENNILANITNRVAKHTTEAAKDEAVLPFLASTLRKKAESVNKVELSDYASLFIKKIYMGNKERFMSDALGCEITRVLLNSFIDEMNVCQMRYYKKEKEARVVLPVTVSEQEEKQIQALAQSMSTWMWEYGVSEIEERYPATLHYLLTKSDVDILQFTAQISEIIGESIYKRQIKDYGKMDNLHNSLKFLLSTLPVIEEDIREWIDQHINKNEKLSHLLARFQKGAEAISEELVGKNVQFVFDAKRMLNIDIKAFSRSIKTFIKERKMKSIDLKELQDGIIGMPAQEFITNYNDWGNFMATFPSINRTLKIKSDSYIVKHLMESMKEKND